jgi:DnaJ-class molecular chaperone
MTTETKSDEVKCPECDGTGNDAGMKPVRLGAKLEHRPCTKCGGSGVIKKAAN